jgi:membrane protease YdiL (CAAX protease family)
VTSNEKNLTKGTEFTGIWDRANKKSDIIDQAEELVVPHAELGAKVKKRKWGVKDVVINFFVFIFVQLVVVLIASWIFSISSTSSDPVEATAALVSSPWIILCSSISMYATWLLGMLYVTHFKGKKSLKIDFKLYMRWYDPLIGIAIAGALMGLVALSSWVLGDVLNLNMKGSDNGTAITAFTGVWFFVIAIGIASIVGPLFEEIFFRGFVLRAFLETIKNNLARVSSEEEAGFGLAVARGLYKARNWIAVGASSIFFGLMHVQGFETFGQIYVMIATGTLGLVFGICALKFKRLGPVIFAHMFYNGTTLILSVM